MNLNKSFTDLLTAIGEDQNKSFMDILQEDGKVQDVALYDDKFKASVDISNCFSNYMYFLSKIDELSINITSFVALSKVQPKVGTTKPSSITLVASPYGVNNSKIFLAYALYKAMFENQKILVQNHESLETIELIYNSLPEHLKIKTWDDIIKNHFITRMIYQCGLKSVEPFDSHIDFFIYDSCQLMKVDDFVVFTDIPGIYNADGGDLRTATEAINNVIGNKSPFQSKSLQTILVKYNPYEMHMSKEAIQRIIDSSDNDAGLIGERLLMEFPSLKSEDK